ncbi:hypothetical protein JVU11DRAFT_9694 [Chiua virens]|nr:hypothetical protein JVU11DRAFT_9694 [Chiua virens]
MSLRSQQRLLSQLATSPNDLASGLGQCLEALRLISALPRASPVFVTYTSSASATSPTTKAFGRDHLSRVPLRTVIALIKTSLGLSDPVRIITASFYRDDGTIDPTLVLVDEDSWKELAPYVHTLHVEDDFERPLSALSSFSSPSTLAGTVVGNGVGNGSALGMGKGPGLNSSASAFIPSSGSSITIKTADGAKLSFEGLLKKPAMSPKPTMSPSSPQPTSPFAILDNTGTCV